MLTLRDYIELGLALAVPAGVIALALFYWYGQKVFATKEDLNGVGTRVDKVEARTDRIEGIAEGNREQLKLISQAMATDRERLAETVAAPLKEIKAKVDSIDGLLQTMRVEHSTKIAQHDQGLSSLGRSVDDLRTRVEKVEAKP